MRFSCKKTLSTVFMSLLTTSAFAVFGPHIPPPLGPHTPPPQHISRPSKELLKKLPHSKTIRIKSARNNKYFAARKIGKNWVLKADAGNTDPAGVFTILRLGDWIGIMSQTARRFNLSSEPGKMRVGFINANFFEWEQWVLVGGSLDNCWLQSKSTLGFLSNRPENWAGLGPNTAWTRDQNVRPTKKGSYEALSIEIVDKEEPPKKQLKLFTQNLESAKKIGNYDQKLKAYENLKRYLFFQTEYEPPFFNALDELIENRMESQLKPIGNMIKALTTYAKRLIDILEGKNQFVPAKDAKKYTQLSKNELTAIIDKLNKRRKITLQPVAFSEIINRANRQLLIAAEKPKIKKIWFANLNYLSSNMAKQSKEDIKTLTDLAKSISEALDPTNSFTQGWRNKFMPTEKKEIQTQINKILKPPAVKPVKVKETEATKEKRSPQEFRSVLKKAKRVLDLDSIHQSTINREQWLTDLAFLNNNRMGQSITNLKEFTDLIKNIDKNYLAFGLWFNQFSTENQTRLQKIITTAKQPLDYAAVLTETYKTLSDGSNVKTDLTRETWLNNFEFLEKRSKGQSEENLKTLDRIVKTVTKWMKFPSWIRNFSGKKLVTLRRLTRESATALEVALVFPYEPIIKNAQDASSFIDLEGKPGKISLYEKAIDAVTENVPFKKRLKIINDHLIPLVKKVLVDEKSGKDIEILKKLSALLTYSKGKLGPGIEEKEKKQINILIESKIQEIVKTIESIQQGTAIQAFKEKIDKAKAATPYTAKISSFKSLLAEIGTSPERKGLFMTEVKILVDNRRRNQLPTLTSLLSYIVGSASYDPALKKANFSIDELNKLKKQACKPLAYAEVIKRTSDHLSSAIESDAKRKLWISNLNYLSNNTAGKSKKDVEAVKLLFSQTIHGNLMYNPEWSNNFTAEEKATIQTLLEKIKAAKVAEKKEIKKTAIKAEDKKVEEEKILKKKTPEPKRPTTKRRVRR